MSRKPPRRQLQVELLDELPVTSVHAVRARRDLRRVNTFMRNAHLMAALMKNAGLQGKFIRLAELGGGDGTLMLKAARLLGPQWGRVQLELVDRQDLVTSEIIAQYHRLGWEVQVVRSEVFEWLGQAKRMDCITANLFLHHFTDSQLSALFELVAGKTLLFVACEPRRFSFPVLAGSLVKLIGANWVTHHDAIASIRAGFRGNELSALWTGKEGWELQERAAGLFSHVFRARHRQSSP